MCIFDNNIIINIIINIAQNLFTIANPLPDSTTDHGTHG